MFSALPSEMKKVGFRSFSFLSVTGSREHRFKTLSVKLIFYKRMKSESILPRCFGVDSK